MGEGELPGHRLVFPSVRRRMAAFLYEGVLLFGVVMMAGYLFSSLTQQRHALQGMHGLQAFVFLVLSWVWFLPALGLAEATGGRTGMAVWGWMSGGVLLIATAARFSPDRQFLHDLICGTRIIDAKHHPSASLPAGG